MKLHLLLLLTLCIDHAASSHWGIRKRMMSILSIATTNHGKHTIQQEKDVAQENKDMGEGSDRYQVVEVEYINLDGLKPGKEYHVSVAYGSDVPEEINLGKASSTGSIRDKARIITAVDKEGRDDDDLSIEVVRKRAIGGDEYLGKVVFKRKDIMNNEKVFQLKGPLPTNHSKEAENVDLRLGLRNRKWSEAYMNIDDRPSEKGVANFFNVAAKALHIERDNTKNPKAHEIKPPTKKADPDLKMASELGGTLEFPEHAEFVPVEIYKKSMSFLL